MDPRARCSGTPGAPRQIIDAACRARDIGYDPVYTTADLMGVFVDAISHGHPADGEIVGYCWKRPGEPLTAIIKNKNTGECAYYKANVDTGKLHRIRSVCRGFVA